MCTRRFFYFYALGVSQSVWDPFCLLLKGPIEWVGNLTCGGRRRAGTGTEAAVCRVPAPRGALMKYAHQAATRLPLTLNPVTQRRAPQDSLFTFSPRAFGSSNIVFALQARLEATPVARTAGILFVFKKKKLNVFLFPVAVNASAAHSLLCFPAGPADGGGPTRACFTASSGVTVKLFQELQPTKGRSVKNLLPCVDQLARSHIHA